MNKYSSKYIDLWRSLEGWFYFRLIVFLYFELLVIVVFLFENF